MLDIDITPESALQAFNDQSFMKALIYSVYLNKSDLMNKFINSIPTENIKIIANKLPLNAVGPLLDFLANKLNTDRPLELCLM